MHVPTDLKASEGCCVRMHRDLGFGDWCNPHMELGRGHYPSRSNRVIRIGPCCWIQLNIRTKGTVSQPPQKSARTMHPMDAGNKATSSVFPASEGFSEAQETTSLAIPKIAQAEITPITSPTHTAIT